MQFSPGFMYPHTEQSRDGAAVPEEQALQWNMSESE